MTEKWSAREKIAVRRALKVMLGRAEFTAVGPFLHRLAEEWGISFIPQSPAQRMEERRKAAIAGREPRNFSARRKEKKDAEAARRSEPDLPPSPKEVQ